MNMSGKYVSFEHATLGEAIVLLSEAQYHNEVVPKEAKVLGAGYFEIKDAGTVDAEGTTMHSIQCFGQSIGLDIESRYQADTQLLCKLFKIG